MINYILSAVAGFIIGFVVRSLMKDFDFFEYRNGDENRE